MKPIRILHEDVELEPGGIETQLMNLYRNIDRNKVQFDFLLHRPHKGAYEAEVLSLGGRIYKCAPFNPFHYYKYMKDMNDFFSAHPEYKIMIAHTELGLGALKAARKAGVPVRISYAHNAKSVINLKFFFMEYEKLFLKNYATDLFTVSILAGRYLFGDKAVGKGKVRMIKNGIVPDKFDYNPDIRNEMRTQLGLNGQLVIGNVGRFMKQKNHVFILEVFSEILKIHENSVLLLVGEGRLESNIRAKISELGIVKKVIFLGKRPDVNKINQAMDVFLLPSLWEGFPNVAIESQAAGLLTFMSSAITDEACFTDLAKRISLSTPASEWAKIVIDDYYNRGPRRSMLKEIQVQGYDVRLTAKWYEQFYAEKISNIRKSENTF